MRECTLSHPLAHFLNAWDSQGWYSPKQGPGAASRPPALVAEAKVCEPPPAALLSAGIFRASISFCLYLRKRMESRQVFSLLVH